MLSTREEKHNPPKSCHCFVQYLFIQLSYIKRIDCSRDTASKLYNVNLIEALK